MVPRPVKIFFIERTGRHARLLRLYGDNPRCWPGQKYSYCNAAVHIGDFDGDSTEVGLAGARPSQEEYAGDPRWPTVCEHCGQPLEALPEVTRQVFIDPIYVRRDTGQQAMFRQWQKIAGATWDAEWLKEYFAHGGPDGRCLVTVCPCGHHWMIDGRASNCTMPHDSVHKCWVRHGDIENMSVDKNGVTCAAGAGSIMTPEWHGFLRNGWLVDG